MNETSCRDFLLEVGTDELPARFLPIERAHLETALPALLDDLGLSHGDIRIYAAPRRLAVHVRDLQTLQIDVDQEIKGPPLKVAYTEDGTPTPAAQGFARKNGIDLADAYQIEDAKGGVFLAVKRRVPGRGAAELLAESLPELLFATPFPKTMHWGRSELEYARPVQWLVALLGDRIVTMSFCGIEAGRDSRGHRTLQGNRTIEITDADAYLDALRSAQVIVDQQERRQTIIAGVESLVVELDGHWLRDEDLLDEVVDLCEFPTPFKGAYSDEFFELPDEVIVTALKAHQRYFAVARRSKTGLMPAFISVRDGDDHSLETVRLGNEKVLRARLSDALFYWNFDQKQTPDDHVERLADVTWIEGYGSVLEKTGRVKDLCAWLWTHGMGASGGIPEDLLRAAHLAKFDIVTEMIRDGKEFTKLEGIIGARYAARAGESDAVCRTLETFHKPRSAHDETPTTTPASILSIAERADTLAGCWLAGYAPTGAKDPYALRRHTLAILRILIDRDARISLHALLERAVEAYAGTIADVDIARTTGEILDFVMTRLEGLMVAEGLSQEAVRAVLPAHGDDPTNALAWARSLEGYRGAEDFLLLATGFKRCRNILNIDIHQLGAAETAACVDRWQGGGASPEGLDFKNLVEIAECDLRDQVAAAIPHLVEGAETGDYAAVFKRLSDLGPAIDVFFDSVRVNVDDPDLMSLRHAFLTEIYCLFAVYADFSHVAPHDNSA